MSHSHKKHPAPGAPSADSGAGAGWGGTFQFLRHFVRRPVEMGAIAPSGRRLARTMVDASGVQPGQVVVELGAGNGSFTRELVARHPENPLTVFEVSPELAEGLRRSFPGVQVVAAPIEELPGLAASLGITQIDRVVSGLPWALWRESRQAAILDALTPFLNPGARMVSFHYLHSRALGRVSTTRRLLRERFEQVRHSAPVWANLPPAYVHIAERPRRGR